MAAAGDARDYDDEPDLHIHDLQSVSDRSGGFLARIQRNLMRQPAPAHFESRVAFAQWLFQAVIYSVGRSPGPAGHDQVKMRRLPRGLRLYRSGAVKPEHKYWFAVNYRDAAVYGSPFEYRLVQDVDVVNMDDVGTRRYIVQQLQDASAELRQAMAECYAFDDRECYRMSEVAQDALLANWLCASGYDGFASLAVRKAPPDQLSKKQVVAEDELKSGPLGLLAMDVPEDVDLAHFHAEIMLCDLSWLEIVPDFAVPQTMSAYRLPPRMLGKAGKANSKARRKRRDSSDEDGWEASPPSTRSRARLSPPPLSLFGPLSAFSSPERAPRGLGLSFDDDLLPALNQTDARQDDEDFGPVPGTPPRRRHDPGSMIVED